MEFNHILNFIKIQVKKKKKKLYDAVRNMWCRSGEVQVCQGDVVWKKALEFLDQYTLSHLDSKKLNLHNNFSLIFVEFFQNEFWFHKQNMGICAFWLSWLVNSQKCGYTGTITFLRLNINHQTSRNSWVGHIHTCNSPSTVHSLIF